MKSLQDGVIFSSCIPCFHYAEVLINKSDILFGFLFFLMGLLIASCGTEIFLKIKDNIVDIIHTTKSK